MPPKKADANQPSIVKLLRQIPGVTVLHLHTVGKGCPDILVGVDYSRISLSQYSGERRRVKFNYLIELKDGAKPPSARKLTPDEEKFFATWAGQVNVCESFEDVIKIIFGGSEKV